MKGKKVNFYTVLLLGIVIYSVALLTYWTMKNVFNVSVENISAIGSILGACGAFFAAFVAAYLFNDWRDQHNKSIVNQFSLDTYKAFSELEGSVMNCALKIDLLQSSILDDKYDITDYTPRYNECQPSIIQIIDEFNIIKMRLTGCFDKLRAYAAVAGKTDQLGECLKQYTDLFTEINSTNISKFDSVQDFIAIAGIQMNKISELSRNIYNTSIKEMLESLQIQS